MDSGPASSRLLLLLAGLLTFRQCAGDLSFYTIDTVGLTVLPSRTVESGTPVTLKCEVSVSHDPSLHLIHRFQFTRYDVPIRAVNTTETEALYQLTAARAADTGTYECRVTVEDKSKVGNPLKLTVTGLQTPLLQLSRVVLFESEELIATCSAPEEKGSLRFHFYQDRRNGEPQEIKLVGPSGNSSETKLVQRLAGDSDLYCDYDIPTLPEAGRSNHSNRVQIIVKGIFITPTMNVLPSTRVFEGDVIEVVCKVVNPPPNVQVFLKKDKRVLSKNSVGLIHRITVQMGDSGEFVCKAEWGSAQKETYETIVVKELFSRPQLTMDPIGVFEGEPFTLTCTISSYSAERIDNETMQFSIYKDHIQLTEMNTYSTVAHSSLNGNYTCKAKAKPLLPLAGKTFFKKESEIVVVQAKVPVSQPVMSVVGGRLIVGKPFLLQCHSELGSLPITYTLHGPNNRLPEVKVVSRPGDQAVFNTSAVKKSSDIPNFLCHAKNNEFNPPMRSTGQQLQHTTDIIEPVSRPVLTMSPNMGFVSEGQDLTLACAVQQGTTPITFTWYHLKRDSPLEVQILDGKMGYFVIRGLRGEHEGGYYCVGSNQAGDDKKSLPVIVGVKLAGWKKGLIAAFCILLTVALILVIIVKKGLLPLRRTRTRELSVKSASTKVERLSLTQAEVNEAANVTPGVMGRSVWSDHVSGSESDDQNSVAPPEEAETQYTEVQARQVDPNRAPVKKGTDTVYSEVRNSRQGASDQADAGSVEYAQLNHDISQHNGHHNHEDHDDGGQEDHLDEINDLDKVDHVDHGECNHDAAPDC